MKALSHMSKLSTLSRVQLKKIHQYTIFEMKRMIDMIIYLSSHIAPVTYGIMFIIVVNSSIFFKIGNRRKIAINYYIKICSACYMK